MAQLTILNGITSTPLAGANVFVVYTNGTQVTYASLVSDGTGRVTLAPGAAAITVTLAGYSGNTGTDGNTEIALTPVMPPAATLLFSVEPNQDQTSSTSVAPSAGSIISFQDSVGSPPEQITVGQDGSAISVRSYSSGTYGVTVTNPNFNTLTQMVTLVNGQTDVLLTLTKTTTAPAATTVAATMATVNQVSTAPSSTAAATSNTDEPYEYVYPNSVDGKYFQAAQARMYIGKHFVDELNLCQWTAAQNRIPIYGYRSSKFDAMGTGRSLVQGQLAVNFISEGYMYILLQEFQKKISSSLNNTTLAGVPASLQTQINSLIKQRAAAAARGGSTSTFDTLLVTAGKSSPQAAAYISAALSSGNLDTSGGVTGANSITHQNAIYLNIPFDIVVNLEGAGRTVTKTLKNCFLGANDFSFAHDGKTLLDTYSFIARDVS